MLIMVMDVCIIHSATPMHLVHIARACMMYTTYILLYFPFPCVNEPQPEIINHTLWSRNGRKAHNGIDNVKKWQAPSIRLSGY